MKTTWHHLEDFRKSPEGLHSRPGDHMGAFMIPMGSAIMVCIASAGDKHIPWEHVSCRASSYKGDRTPTWAEMCWVKDQFWAPDECVIQFHPPKDDHVNIHPHVLHLWKPTREVMPRPPKMAV